MLYLNDWAHSTNKNKSFVNPALTSKACLLTKQNLLTIMELLFVRYNRHSYLCSLFERLSAKLL